MTKEEIYEKINGWIDDGTIVQKSSVIADGHWYSVWQSVKKGELFFTGNDRIVATDKDVRDEFQRLLMEGRVMSLTDVTIRHPECVTARMVSKLVEQGDLLKIGRLKAVTLYVE